MVPIHLQKLPRLSRGVFSNETQIACLLDRGCGRTRLRLSRVGIEVHRRELRHPRRNGGVAVQLYVQWSRRLRSGGVLSVQGDWGVAAAGVFACTARDREWHP